MSFTDRKDQIKKYLTSPETFATVLFFLMYDIYGAEFVDWESDTLDVSMKTDLNCVMPQCNKDKIWALSGVMSGDRFYTDIISFINTCNALNCLDETKREGISTEVFDPAWAHECIWAMTEIKLLDPPEEQQEYKKMFSPEIRGYIGITCAYEGYLNPPDPLSIADFPGYETKNIEENIMLDAELYSGFQNIQKANNEELISIVKENLSKLIKQLNEVPLHNRDKKTWDRFYNKIKELNN